MARHTRLECGLRPAREKPRGALVMHHGRGADAQDLLPLVDVLDPNGELAAVTPQGPLQLPPGGWHWYIVPRVGYPDPPTFWESFGLLDELHEALPEETGVPWDRTIIGGFSQGTAMSYALGLSEQRPAPAGIIALSGFIPNVPEFTPHLSDRTDLPVFIGHGTEDPVIPVELAREAKQTLEQAGLPVSYHEAPIGHGIHPDLIPALRDWIAARLA